MGPLYFALSMAVCAFLCASGDQNIQQCVDDMVSWCNQQDFTHAGNYLTSYPERINGQYEYVQCISDRSGTRCTKDGYSWYSCSQDHRVLYKGNELQMNSESGADGDLCYTVSRLNRGEEISAEVKETLKKTGERIGESMQKLRERLGRKCFPFCKD